MSCTLFGSIPAFAAEISSIEVPRNGGVVHCRLVLAGNELGLVPWEIVQVPIGQAPACTCCCSRACRTR